MRYFSKGAIRPTVSPWIRTGANSDCSVAILKQHSQVLSQLIWPQGGIFPVYGVKSLLLNSAIEATSTSVCSRWAVEFQLIISSIHTHCTVFYTWSMMFKVAACYLVNQQHENKAQSDSDPNIRVQLWRRVMLMLMFISMVQFLMSLEHVRFLFLFLFLQLGLFFVIQHRLLWHSGVRML